MSKRRILKKEISYTAGDLFTETVIVSQCLKEEDTEKINQLMSRILEMVDSFIVRADHPDAKDNPKMVKAFYKKLREDFDKEVEAIDTEINQLASTAK